MDVLPVIKKRFSVRKYQDKPVDREVLMRLMEAARIAPSASNRQEWRFVIIEDSAKRVALCQAAMGQSFVSKAPVIIVACAETDDHVMACGEKCYPIDVAIALQHVALQAVHEGLGTCWIGAFEQEKVKTILGIPEGVRVVDMLTVGYADCDPPSTKRRKDMEEIVCFEKWSF